MSLVERIANNDPELKELRLADPAKNYFKDVSEIIDALRDNSYIEVVRIDRDFLPSLLGQPEKKAAVVKAIGQLKNLRELRIVSGPVHAVVLGCALKDAEQLESLELGAVNMKGNAEDFAALESAMKGHKTLSAFSMSNFTVDQDEINLDNLVKSLGTIPTLEKLTLEVNKNASAHFSGEALASLFYSHNIKELRIANFRLYVQHYEIIADAVKKSNNLKILKLNRVGMANPCSKKISEALVDNTSLEYLDLSSNDIGDEGCMALAKGFKDNKKIKHLRLWDNKQIGTDGFAALAEMLEVNEPLDKLDAPVTGNAEYRVKIADILKKKSQAAITA